MYFYAFSGSIQEGGIERLRRRILFHLSVQGTSLVRYHKECIEPQERGMNVFVSIVKMPPLVAT